MRFRIAIQGYEEGIKKPMEFRNISTEVPTDIDTVKAMIEEKLMIIPEKKKFWIF